MEDKKGRGLWDERMEAHVFFFTPPCKELSENKAQEGNDLRALEPTGAYSTSK